MSETKSCFMVLGVEGGQGKRFSTNYGYQIERDLESPFRNIHMLKSEEELGHHFFIGNTALINPYREDLLDKSPHTTDFPPSGPFPSEKAIWVETILNKCEGESLIVDGFFEPDAWKAIRRFQQKFSLPITGGFDDRTLRALTQRALNVIQMSILPITGIMDGRTKAEVIRFQSSNFLTKDAIVGRDTRAAMVAAFNSISDKRASGTTPPTSPPFERVGFTGLDQVKIWINAFIPRDIPGTPGLAIPAPPPHTGKTMIREPFSSIRLPPSPDFPRGGVPIRVPITNKCTLTDNRSFSPLISASSRMQSVIAIDLSGSDPVEIGEIQKCDPSHEINCTTGETTCFKHASTLRMGFSNLRKGPSGTVQVDIKAAANYPCFRGSPDVDYEGTITIDPPTGVVKFDGLIDVFPAFEMYAANDINATTGQVIFTLSPLPGKSPINLFGKATIKISGVTTLPVGIPIRPPPIEI